MPSTTYYYDLINRLVKYEEKGTNFSHSVTYIYNAENNLQTLTEVINGVKTVYNYTYDDDNRVTSVTVGNGTTVISSVSYTYDAFGRMSQQVTKHGDSTSGTTVLTESATFNPGNTENSTSSQIASYNGFTYTYDDNGNITSVTYDGKTTTYQYDSANQLIREDNEHGSLIMTWEYDAAGNIQSWNEYSYYPDANLNDLEPVDTVNYTYGDSNWGDLLTGYRNQTITYDQIGNPLNNGTWTYTWQHGRQLASMSQIDKDTQEILVNWEYTYNADGLRTKRTDGTTTYNYVYNGSQLAQMTVGGNTLIFTYDAAGVPLSVTLNGTVYYYRTNLQGDVISILDSDGDTIVTYDYTAYGHCCGISASENQTIAELNPLRYRGYVYDTETSLYYLQSRYYDPIMCRFINADAYMTTDNGLLSNNMYVFCFNNPLIFTDHTGYEPEWWQWLVSGAMVVGGAVMIATGVGGPLGGALICAGANSIINSYVTEATGGSSEAGWWGGLTSGLICGLGAGVAGEFLISASQASGLTALGYLGLSGLTATTTGTVGSYSGQIISATIDDKPVDKAKIFRSSLMVGVVNNIVAIGSGMGSAVTSLPQISTTTAALACTINLSITLIVETICDYVCTILN